MLDDRQERALSRSSCPSARRSRRPRRERGELGGRDLLRARRRAPPRARVRLDDDPVGARPRPPPARAAARGRAARPRATGRRSPAGASRASSTATAPRSSVKRVAVSNVLIPRSQRMIRSFPSLATYSAAISSSSTDADGPRFSSTGLSERPTSESSRKFCMLRAPIWITSRVSSTSSTCRGSISSVTTGKPVSSRASPGSRAPRRRAPGSAYGEVRGLNAPPRSIVAPAAATARAVSSVCSRYSTEHGPGDQAERAVADAAAVDVDHGRVGRELARDELVRLQDRQHLLDARDSPRAAARRAARGRRSRRSPSPRGRAARAPARRPPRAGRARARSRPGVAAAPITISSSGDPFELTRAILPRPSRAMALAPRSGHWSWRRRRGGSLLTA